MENKKLFWKSLNSEYALNTKWLRVRREVVKLPSGKILDDFYTVEGNELVAIFAIDKNDNIVLVKQYRHPIKDVTVDLPGGGVEKGERLIEAAKRELAEETGMTAGHIEKLLTYYPDSGKTACTKHIFYATDLKKNMEHQHPKSNSEETHLILMPFKKVLEGIKSGELKEATLHISVSAYLNQQKNDED